MTISFGTRVAVNIFYERQKEVSGGMSVWDFLFLIPDKEILIKTYPYPNKIKDYGSPVNTFGNDRWVVILRERGVSGFLTDIQKIAKINSGSVNIL